LLTADPEPPISFGMIYVRRLDVFRTFFATREKHQGKHYELQPADSELANSR
jgi:hypothetical protein